MDRILEFIFVGFLTVVLCAALANWFYASENCNAYVDVVKWRTVNSAEVIQTDLAAVPSPIPYQ